MNGKSSIFSAYFVQRFFCSVQNKNGNRMITQLVKFTLIFGRFLRRDRCKTQMSSFLHDFLKYLHVIKEMKIDIIEGTKDNKWMI